VVRERGENLVVLLGYANYYPRFGFRLAPAFGIQAPFEVNDENLTAIVLDESRPVPTGVIHYPEAFGIRAPVAEPRERVYGFERGVLQLPAAPGRALG
jgi:hypothetical protein